MQIGGINLTLHVYKISLFREPTLDTERWGFQEAEGQQDLDVKAGYDTEYDSQSALITYPGEEFIENKFTYKGFKNRC